MYVCVYICICMYIYIYIYTCTTFISSYVHVYFESLCIYGLIHTRFRRHEGLELVRAFKSENAFYYSFFAQVSGVYKGGV